MKLRFHNNTLRLRLSQSDVAELEETGMVECRITFTPQQSLVYSVAACPVPEISATINENRVNVLVPRVLAKRWIHSSEVGIEGASPSLNILIEKDFQCLHRESPEDTDSFPNPLAASVSEPSSRAKPPQK